MAGLLLKLRTWWELADRTQKSVTLFGGAFLAVLLLATFYFASKPKMEIVFGGLSPTDVGSVTGEVQKLGIPVEFDLQGNVLVPTDKVAEVRAKLASAGKSPTTGHLGNEELAKFSIMTAPNVESERLKTILEGELARSIEMISGVAAARVHLTRGERSAFASEKKPASASIFVTEKPGGGITPESARAIAMLVTNAVSGLESNRVFVLDNAGRPLYDGSDASGVGGQANQKLEAEQREALRRERDLQAKLDAVIGRGTSLVTVDLEMDFDKLEREVEGEKTGKEPISRNEATEILSPGGTTTTTPSGGSGLGGNDANNTRTETQTTPDGKKYESKVTQNEYPSTRTSEHTVKAVGSITRMSIAVLVDEAKVQDPAPVKQYLEGYTGKDPRFNYTVTQIKFDKTAEEDAKKSAAANGSRETLQQAMSLLPVIALLVVAFLVMKAIAKAAKSQTVMVSAMADGTLVAGMPSLEGSRGHHQHGHTAADDAMQALAHHAQEDVGEIETRMNKPLEQIKRMAQDRPESVAMLLKSWLLEERR